MLRLFSSKIFREDVPDYALPMFAFENFDDLEGNLELDNGTYKFLIPVSVGDFPETNVPACFSNNKEELRSFYNEQKNKNKRKAFIISDFLVDDMENILYSGTITVSSKPGYADTKDKSTTITVSYKNPIKTYATEHVSPRDLKEDVVATFDRMTDEEHSFPKITNKSSYPLRKAQSIIVQAFDASRKLHEASSVYDGSIYDNYVLFYVDQLGKIRLYEIVGAESFVNRSRKPQDLIREELDIVKIKGEKKILAKRP
jgi:hypothetical protein